ncbi:MAG TPA: SpoIID/LytB domain-containing protein [Fimbriimonadaceae bacterium]|nr:SpoIID/LytB domain-containing protein [Fimbriimonadaceae bacterium]
MRPFLIVAILVLSIVIGVQASQKPTGQVEVSIVDEATGIGLSGQVSLSASSRTTQNAVKYRMTFDLTPGTYQLGARAEGFESAFGEVVVRENVVTKVKVNLDPTSIDPRWSYKVLKAEVSEGRMLVQGTITDAVTGLPIEGAQVYAEGTETYSESDGFFRMQILAGDGTTHLSISHPDIGSMIRKNVRIWPYGDTTYRVSLEPGQNSVIDEANPKFSTETKSTENCDECKLDEKEFGGGGTDGSNAPALPKSIRVGRNCPTATTCTTIELFSVDSYVKRVVPAEWYSCWGNVTGGLDCLRAGAVAVRSYGVYHVYNPRTSTYDICDTTSCQVVGASTSSNTDLATDQTTRYVLLSNGNVARSEYSAENNNAGCGDGFSGTGTSTAPCINDPVCTGFSTFGHGRGLCQWGSARWATGKRLSSSLACSNSAPSTGQGTKTWQQILAHYYPLYTLEQGSAPSIVSMSASPTNPLRGTTFTLNYGVLNNATVNNVMLGASIAPTGTSTVTSNAANDLKVTLPTGTNTQSRPFSLPLSQVNGIYDILGALYYDRNNSNTINAGDFVMAELKTVGNLTVSANVQFVLYKSLYMAKAGLATTLTARLRRQPELSAQSGKLVTFKVGGVAVGTATTDATGFANFAYTPSLSLSGGPKVLTAEFAGNNGLLPATATGQIVIISRD